MSVRQAATALDTGIHQASAAFRQLEDRGFIKPRQRGAFQWKARHATSWLLTEYMDDVAGHEPTKHFMRWRPAGEPKNKSRLPLRQQSVAAPAEMASRMAILLPLRQQIRLISTASRLPLPHHR